MVPNQKYYYTFRTIGADISLERATGIIERATGISKIDTYKEAMRARIEGTLLDDLDRQAALSEALRDQDIDPSSFHLFSNPTPVYEVELADDDGAVYLLIRTVDFDILHPPPTHKTMKRLLHIKPSIGHSLVNPRYVEETTRPVIGSDKLELFYGDPEPKYTTASDVLLATGGKIALGMEAKPIWERTFKVRLTSRETCRKLDLNVRFKTEHINLAQCNPPTIVGVPYDAEEEVP